MCLVLFSTDLEGGLFRSSTAIPDCLRLRFHYQATTIAEIGIQSAAIHRNFISQSQFCDSSPLPCKAASETTHPKLSLGHGAYNRRLIRSDGQRCPQTNRRSIMPDQAFAHLRKSVSLFLTLIIALGPSITPAFAGAAKSAPTGDSHTTTPIKHVIIIVGENRSFDHLFATYVPKSGNSVSNLLSQGIINADGTPGPNYSRAIQFSADITGSTSYQPSPTTGKMPYPVLPAPLNGGPSNVCTDNGMCNLGDAVSSEDGLPKPPLDYYRSLLVGGSGLTGRVPDSRISGVNASPPYSTLTPGPFQITNKATFPITRTPIVLSTVSIKCGSKRTATHRTQRQPIPAVAWRISSLGRRSRSGPM